jgi:hypothetical protein
VHYHVLLLEDATDITGRNWQVTRWPGQQNFGGDAKVGFYSNTNRGYDC